MNFTVRSLLVPVPILRIFPRKGSTRQGTSNGAAKSLRKSNLVPCGALGS